MWKDWQVSVMLMAFAVLVAVSGCVVSTKGIDIKETTIDTNKPAKDVGAAVLDPT